MTSNILSSVSWKPTEKEIQSTHLFSLQEKLKLPNYAAVHRWSVNHREDFWRETISRLGIVFRNFPEKILNLDKGIEAPDWLVGAKLNITESCFQEPPDKVAIYFQRESGSLQSITYGALDKLSNQVANGLKDIGVCPGDPIAIAMAMTVESVAIYLGILKLGAVVVSIADSFAPSEIETRIRITKAELAFSQDCILRGGKVLPLYEKVIASKVKKIIVLPTEGAAGSKLRSEDLSWGKFLSSESRFSNFVGDPKTPINILFSSGTTGDPKAIPWEATTAIKAASDGYYHQDIHATDRVAWPTNLGWMMGPWLIFATFINRASMALYYGSPTGREFGKFIEEARTSVFGLVPSMVKNWRKTKCMEGLDWSSIKCFSSTGECSSAEDYGYLMGLAGNRPVIEYCGGTEIGGGYVSGTLVQPSFPATFSTPCLGIDFLLLDESGKPSNTGEVFLVPPSVGLSTRLMNRDHHEVYFAGTPRGASGEILRKHGDEMERLENGYYRGLGRADDTMNLGGIKVSSAEIERVLNKNPEIIETAAVARTPKGGGPSELVVFAVLQDANVETISEGLLTKLQASLKKELNPLFKIESVILVKSLPRTASNKVMRRELRAQLP